LERACRHKKNLPAIAVPCLRCLPSANAEAFPTSGYCATAGSVTQRLQREQNRELEGASNDRTRCCNADVHSRCPEDQQWVNSETVTGWALVKDDCLP